MREDTLTAYHEAGHILIGAMVGKRVKHSLLLGSTGCTDFFATDEPLSLPEGRIAGIVDPHAFKTQEAEPCSREDSLVAAYSDAPLEDNLLRLVAGVEASLIYAEQQHWDTAQLSKERDDLEHSQDRQTIHTLLNRAGRLEEGERLIHQARTRARTLLQTPHIWHAVCLFAQLLQERSFLHWSALEEAYTSVIDELMQQYQAQHKDANESKKGV